MGRCRCEDCRRDRKRQDPRYRNPLRKWAIDTALDRFYRERWLPARDARVEKCIADILGYAREHTAIIEVPPRHAKTQSAVLLGNAWAGIDRTVAPKRLAGSWLSAGAEPFSLETFREAVLRIIAAPVLPPVKPWIRCELAARLVSRGISRRLLESTFEIY